MPSPVDLYARIAAKLGTPQSQPDGTTKPAAIGTYKLPNNTTRIALYTIVNIDKDPPRNWQTTGVECLIHRAVDRAPVGLFGAVADKYQWTIEMIQHDRSESLDYAIELVMSLNQRVKFGYHKMQTEDAFEQAKLLIPSQQYIDVDRI